MESPKAGIVLKENPLYDNSDFAFNKSKKEAHPEMQTRETTESSQTPVVKATDKGKNVVQENQPQQQSVSVASLSVQRTVSMIEVTNTKQQKGELVIDYINQWRALNLDCKDRLIELIASRGTKDFLVPKVRKYRKETKSAEKVVKSTVKESMIVNTTPLKFSKRKGGRTEKKDDGSEVALEDSQEKERSIEEDDEGRGNKAQKNKNKKKIRKLKLVHEEDKNFPRPQCLVTLADFFPTRFLCDHQDENPGVVACLAINATEEESIPLRSLEEEGVSKDLSRFNVDDLLSLPQETKTIFINALLNLAASSSSALTATCKSTPYCMSIDFSDEDLLLGSKLHNRHLYVFGYVREQRVDRILIDNGSAINIMPKSTMRQLDILMDELSNSKLVIQGFNQGNQRLIGMIRLELIIGDLKASTLFHVIDSRTTYKLLIGRPWIHGNGVITLTLHQCFKFYQDSVKKVEADSNPFSEVESHFADAKFYLKNDNSLEAVPVEISLVNRENNLQLKSLASREPHKSTGTFHSGKGETSTSTTKNMILMDEKTSNPPILRYVPLSKRKKGESPFVESPQGLKVGDIEVLKESFTTPLTKITKQEIKIDLTEVSLPQRRTKDEFDLKAYKLMAKAGRLRQGEGEISCHHTTILEELEIETPEEDVEDVSQSLEDGG
ncbi:uncharacterized protein E5676_scaffold1428G00900 [Cucumis melo var. makuwa]|uniref:Ty3-gypsy retrotransposon protein n=1 Tax=Cucumis melo var. makuwa TaxID=1194695 RepID=A0A5A7ST30_CUCMM|nr:uncharacterized protein E6C27_scaffold142G00210 [Cucumis melo var. makuwa]TYK22367.1 uncharacterized protein E5676_scaffold1428G00900 [Cucumis melo var. makuwa]